MNIVKQSTGNVVLTDAAGNIQKVFVNVNALDVKGTDEVIVKYGFNQWHSLFASQVGNTQVEPAGAVPFSGNAFDLVALLSSSFFFELSGGGGAADLATVLGLGNTTGPEDIIFDEFFGLSFDNLSRLREGTIDAGLGGNKGIAQICAVGYELKWEAGRLYVMDGNGVYIRQSLYNFTLTPTVNDDVTKGYLPGSRWTLDNGDTYLCVDETTGAAVWIKEVQPGGGSGGGGVFYYFNYGNTTGIAPTTNLPSTPVAPSQLGINYNVGSGSITSANLTQGSYDLICGFVTIVGTPGVTEIPAGLWDFNIWADILGGSGTANQTQFQIRVYKYDGALAPTLLASSDDIYVYDPATTTQYIGNVTMPQTTILATDRIYIELWAQKNVNQSRQVRFYFDSLHPSHVHTTLPSVSGTGLVKTVNGVMQSPASTLVNADVSATAAIAVSKLSMATSRILGRTTAGTGSVEELQIKTVQSTTVLGSGDVTITDANLSTSDITTNDVSTTKHGFAPKANSSLNGGYLEINGTSAQWVGIIYTIELIAALTVDFYAPYNMKINSVTNILNSPTTTIQDDNVAYVLGATIAAGSKITVTVNTAAVVNLNITKA